MSELNLIRILVTLASFGAFLWIVWSAYAPARKREHEAHGLLPFDGEE